MSSKKEKLNPISKKNNVKDVPKKAVKKTSTKRKNSVKKVSIPKLEVQDIVKATKKVTEVVEKEKKISTKKVEKVSTKPIQAKKTVEKKEKQPEIVQKEFSTPEKHVVVKNIESSELVHKNVIETQKSKVKKVKRKNHTLLITVIVVMLTILIVYLLFGKNISEELTKATYEIYELGEKVTLIDNSEWYVVDGYDSNSKEIKLLSSKAFDVNKDGKYDINDKRVFDKDGNLEVDKNNPDNIGYYLNNTYIKELDGLNGNIEVTLLTSEEFVSIRKKMQYDYEWDEDNILAGSRLANWWLNSNRNEKMYIVTKKGTYRMVNAKDKYYMRPVIIVDKNNIK